MPLIKKWGFKHLENYYYSNSIRMEERFLMNCIEYFFFFLIENVHLYWKRAMDVKGNTKVLQFNSPTFLIVSDQISRQVLIHNLCVSRRYNTRKVVICGRKWQRDCSNVDSYLYRWPLRIWNGFRIDPSILRACKTSLFGYDNNQLCQRALCRFVETITLT